MVDYDRYITQGPDEWRGSRHSREQACKCVECGEVEPQGYDCEKCGEWVCKVCAIPLDRERVLCPECYEEREEVSGETD